MSEKKEFKSLDVGASARIPWKIAKGLRENVGFKDDGSVELAKNLEIDGNVLSLNGGEWGITPVVVYNGVDDYGDSGFILSSQKPYFDTLDDNKVLYFAGLWLNVTGNSDYTGLATISNTIIIGENSNTKIENGVLYLDNTNDEYHNFYNGFADLDDTIYRSKTAQKQIVLHNLTLTANSKTYNITLQSTNNIKVDSIADLRTILNIKATTDSLITPVCASDLTSTACLQITTALCKIGADNVTAVSDKVTTL